MSFRENREAPALLGATVTSDFANGTDEIERLVSVKPARHAGGVIFGYQRQAGTEEISRLPRDKKIAGDIFVSADNARAFARAILELVGE